MRVVVRLDRTLLKRPEVMTMLNCDGCSINLVVSVLTSCPLMVTLGNL